MKVRLVMKGAAVLAAATCGMVVAAQTPASAHDVGRSIGGDYHYYGLFKVTQSHHRIQVCDQNADGIGLYAEFYTSDGGYHTLSDGNGSDDPCGSYTNNSVTITQFNGHTRNGLSTGWVST